MVSRNAATTTPIKTVKKDLLKKSEIEKITSNFSKSIKSEVVLMSTIEKKSISKIKAKLISYAS